LFKFRLHLCHVKLHKKYPCIFAIVYIKDSLYISNSKFVFAILDLL
jgi:hypothetical protein